MSMVNRWSNSMIFSEPNHCPASNLQHTKGRLHEASRIVGAHRLSHGNNLDDWHLRSIYEKLGYGWYDIIDMWLICSLHVVDMWLILWLYGWLYGWCMGSDRPEIPRNPCGRRHQGVICGCVHQSKSRPSATIRQGTMGATRNPWPVENTRHFFWRKSMVPSSYSHN